MSYRITRGRVPTRGIDNGLNFFDICVYLWETRLHMGQGENPVYYA